MAYQATILNVMIASPSDVAEERQLVRDAIYEWNAIHSKRFKVMLNPIGWENNIAPQMGSHPQEIINKSILNDSDILIGIFWTRLGSPTGEYASGTVEEISKHCNTNKLASVYISKKPYPEDINLEQLQRLRNQTQIWLNEGLLDFYDNHSTFKQKIKDHLTLHVQENEYIQGVLKGLSPAPLEKLPQFAKILIIEGTKGNGIISHLRFIDGTAEFSTHEFQYRTKDPREISQWKAAINFLIDNRLIITLSNDNYIHQVFEISNLGWELSNSLSNISA